MSTQSFALVFYTIGHYADLSDDSCTRTAHIDFPADSLPIAASLQSARRWLDEQHPGLDLECAAELPLRGYFAFQSPQRSEGHNVDSAQLVAMDEGFVIRAHLDNDVWAETDLLVLHGVE